MKKKSFTVTHKQHLYLFRLLRPCIGWTEDAKPKPYLLPDPIAKIIFDRLWKLNYSLAVHGVVRYGDQVFSEDALQNALLGLRDGLLRFDPDRGLKPSTYLMWWIRRGVRDRSRNMIRLSWYARLQIKEGVIERPTVFSYDAYASRHGFEDVGEMRFMGDHDSVSSDTQVEARRLFQEWRERFRQAAAVVEREHQVAYILFTLETGYGRFPKGPAKMKVLKRLTGLKEEKIRKQVGRVIELIGRQCGFRDPNDAYRFFDAMVEYSLHSGIPL